jgi:hypothetical protein
VLQQMAGWLELLDVTTESLVGLIVLTSVTNSMEQSPSSEVDSHPDQSLCVQFLHFVVSHSVVHYKSVLLCTGTSNTGRKGLLLKEGC